MKTNQLVLSAHYLPSIAYFYYLNKYGNAIIDTGEHFIKQTYRNRCEIYSANGKQSLIIPVIRNGKTTMKSVLLDQKSNWKKLHWRSIEAAYNSSPFYEFYKDELKNVFFDDYSNLIDFNHKLTVHIAAEIGLVIELKQSLKYIEPSESITDLRNSLTPKIKIPLNLIFPRYIQTFENKHGFIENLSILDLLFHEGPESLNYLSIISEINSKQGS